MENYKEVKTLARRIRIDVLKMLVHLGFGHFGGSLSVVETLAVLYGAVMKVDPKNPDWEDRDYMVLSKGHAGPALYSALAIKGFFDEADLMTLNINGTHLPSHPDRLLTKGVDATTGSLGQGISIAAGIALGAKLSGKENRVFSIVGDGELNEGQCWEAFQFIAHHNLNNLVTFVDYNKQQLDGTLEEIIRPFSFTEKFNAFGFEAVQVKGDDIEGIYSLLKDKRSESQKPLAIILDSKKGQGVKYIEDLKNSHHLRLTDVIKDEIEKVIMKIEKEAE